MSTEISFLKTNKQDEIGTSELHHMVFFNRLSQAEKLLSEGFEVNVRDAINNTPLHYAIKINKNGSHIKFIELLLKNGADPNARDNLGFSPLHYLAKKGKIRIIV